MKPTAEEYLDKYDILIAYGSKTRIDVIAAMEAYAAAVKSEPADDDEKIELGEPDKLKQQPPAEGAEEYLRKNPFLLGETEDGDDYFSTDDNALIEQLAPMFTEFAALHAQRLADKMVEERMPTFSECEEWLNTADFGYSTDYLLRRAGARMGIDWFRSRIKGESK